MLRRIVRFLRDLPKSRRRHEEAWGPVRQPSADGYSPFQLRVEALIVECLRDRGLAIVNRRTSRYRLHPSDPEETLVEADVPELGAEFQISASQTDVWSPARQLRLEEWDTETPEEHLEIVREFVATLPLASSGRGP